MTISDNHEDKFNKTFSVHESEKSWTFVSAVVSKLRYVNTDTP